jgi:hypothetical protein
MMRRGHVKIDIRPDGRKVCPFDHHSPEYAARYREMYKEMRGAGSILWSDSYGGFWIATDYETIRNVLIDTETFTIEILHDNSGGPLIPTPEEVLEMGSTPGLFWFFDGQRHQTARAALNPHFSEGRVAAMADMIRSHVDCVLDRVLPRGEFDGRQEDAVSRAGIRTGRDERSDNAASPPWAYRRSHVCTVARDTPSCSATSAAGQRAATRSTNSLRANRLARALA